MDVNPFSMLELTLEENSDSEIQINRGEEEDPLNITNNSNNLNFPSLPLFGRSATALEKVCHNSNKLAVVSDEELNYRSAIFSSLDLVLKSRLHCTICGVHIGCKPSLAFTDVTHPLLKVLCCVSCTRKYLYVEFPLTPFGQDVRCRWCANPAVVGTNPLRYCSNCPYAFCEKCILRNFPTAKRKDFWICFVCQVTQLWPARAVLSSLLMLVAERRIANSWVDDISQCCKVNCKKRIIRKQKCNGNSINIPPQCSIIPVNKLIIETKWLKDRFRLISVALKEVLDKVNTVRGEMNDTDKADTVQKLLESVVDYVKKGTNQINKTCSDVMNELSVKLNNGKNLHATVLSSSSNHSLEKTESNLLDLPSLDPPKEQTFSIKEETLSTEINGNETNSAKQKKSANKSSNDSKPNIVNSNTTDDSINQKPKPIKVKVSAKKPHTLTVQKKHSTSKRKTKNYQNTIFTENSITEFNGIPIKKCFVQLTRIQIPPETVMTI